MDEIDRHMLARNKHNKDDAESESASESEGEAPVKPVEKKPTAAPAEKVKESRQVVASKEAHKSKTVLTPKKELNKNIDGAMAEETVLHHGVVEGTSDVSHGPPRSWQHA